MAKGRVFYGEVASGSGVTLTTNTSTTGFDGTYLTDTNQGSKYRSSGVTSQIVLDMGSATAIKGAFLMGTNLGASPTKCNFEAHTADSWGSPDVSEAMTAIQNPISENYDFFYASSVTKRYYRFDVEVASGYVEAGLVLLYTDDYTFGLDYGIGNEFGITIQTTGDEVRAMNGHVYRKIISGKRIYTMPFQPNMADAQKNVFITLTQKDHICLFPYGITSDLLYGFWKMDQLVSSDWNNTTNAGTWGTTVTVEECI
jgi:hypothetical protein